MASCIASAFMTVASMPMWSPVTRSMPASRETGAAEDVAATDHAGHLHAALLDLEHFAGDALEHQRVDAEVGRPSSASPDSFTRMRLYRRGHCAFPCRTRRRTLP